VVLPTDSIKSTGDHDQNGEGQPPPGAAARGGEADRTHREGYRGHHQQATPDPRAAQAHPEQSRELTGQHLHEEQRHDRRDGHHRGRQNGVRAPGAAIELTVMRNRDTPVRSTLTARAAPSRVVTVTNDFPSPVMMN
jgi:hypothetical protein